MEGEKMDCETCQLQQENNRLAIKAATLCSICMDIITAKLVIDQRFDVGITQAITDPVTTLEGLGWKGKTAHKEKIDPKVDPYLGQLIALIKALKDYLPA